MVETTKITFLDLQVALFFSEPVKVRPDKLAMTINKELANMFDEIPLMLPVGVNAPANLQMLELKSSTEPFRLTASRLRADIYHIAPSTSFQSFAEHKEVFKYVIEKYFSSIESLEGIKISRVGYVTNFFFYHELGSDYLKGKFIKDDKFSVKIHELNIRYNIRQMINDFEVNNITKLDPAELSGTKGVRIHRDINTVKEKQYNFDLPSFIKFRNAVEELLNLGNIRGILA